LFVLATTEAYKVPPTVVSRCQRFDFHRISNRDVETCLAHICQGEGIEADPQALKAIARNASGSLRDAENLLEQVVVSYGSKITLAGMQELLGLGNDELALELVGHVMKGETGKGLKVINTVADQGLDLRRFHRQVVDHLRGILLLKSGAAEALEYTAETLETMKTIAASTTLEHALLAARSFGQAAPRQDGSPTLPLELALVECSLAQGQESRQTPAAHATLLEEKPRKLQIEQESRQTPAADAPARREERASTQPAPANGQRGKTEPPPPRAIESKPSVAEPTKAPLRNAPPRPIDADDSASRAPEPSSGTIDTDATNTKPDTHPFVKASGEQLPEAQWNSLYQALRYFKGNQFIIGALLVDSRTRYVEEDALVLVYKNRINMERLEGELENPEVRRHVQQAVQQATGTPYTLRLSLADQGGPNPAAPRGHLVRAARAIGAQIVEEGERSNE
ncbi:MAG: hypothetical protein HYX93_06540, partial [Chloroflexi bacterium]|nr:hypothetical protein [Chloroflexota bacterium]